MFQPSQVQDFLHPPYGVWIPWFMKLNEVHVSEFHVNSMWLRPANMCFFFILMVCFWKNCPFVDDLAMKTLWFAMAILNYQRVNFGWYLWGVWSSASRNSYIICWVSQCWVKQIWSIWWRDFASATGDFASKSSDFAWCILGKLGSTWIQTGGLVDNDQ